MALMYPFGMAHRCFPLMVLMFASAGAEKLVRHLHANKVPIAVATSSHSRHFDVKTGNHKDFFALFNHIVTGDEVTRGKPNPDIFQVAASRFSQPPASPAAALVFEDAPTGVEAAVAASMPVVMVPDPQLDPALCTSASQVVKSLEHFRPEEWGLPAYQT